MSSICAFLCTFSIATCYRRPSGLLQVVNANAGLGLLSSDDARQNTTLAETTEVILHSEEVAQDELIKFWRFYGQMNWKMIEVFDHEGKKMNSRGSPPATAFPLKAVFEKKPPVTPKQDDPPFRLPEGFCKKSAFDIYEPIDKVGEYEISIAAGVGVAQFRAKNKVSNEIVTVKHSGMSLLGYDMSDGDHYWYGEATFQHRTSFWNPMKLLISAHRLPFTEQVISVFSPNETMIDLVKPLVEPPVRGSGRVASDLNQWLMYKRRLDEKTVHKFAAQLAYGLWLLQRQGFILRRISLESILMNGEDGVFLGGFDHALKCPYTCDCVAGLPNEFFSQLVAPDVNLNKWKEFYYGQEVDWWSLAVVVYLMATGREGKIYGNDRGEDKLDKLKSTLTSYSQENSSVTLLDYYKTESKPRERSFHTVAGRWPKPHLRGVTGMSDLNDFLLSLLDYEQFSEGVRNNRHLLAADDAALHPVLNHKYWLKFEPNTGQDHATAIRGFWAKVCKGDPSCDGFDSSNPPAVSYCLYEHRCSQEKRLVGSWCYKGAASPAIKKLYKWKRSWIETRVIEIVDSGNLNPDGSCGLQFQMFRKSKDKDKDNDPEPQQSEKGNIFCKDVTATSNGPLVSCRRQQYTYNAKTTLGYDDPWSREVEIDLLTKGDDDLLHVEEVGDGSRDFAAHFSKCK